MLLAIATALFAMQTDQAAFQKPISLDETCITAPALMKKLSGLSGLRLEAIDEIVGDAFALRVDKVPLADLMKRIADTESAEWDPTGSGYRLRRSPKLMQAERQQKYDALMKAFAKSQATYRKTLTEQAQFDDEQAKKLAHTYRLLQMRSGRNMDGNFWQSQNNLQNKLPAGRALERIMLQFPVSELATLPVKHQVVYSLTPTSMERQMPEDLAPILSELITEQDAWSAMMETYAGGQQEGIYYGMLPSNESFRQATKVLLELSRWNETSGVQAQLVLGNAKGHTLAQTTISFGSMYDPEDFKPPAPDPPGKKKLPSVSLTPFEEQATTIFKQAYGQSRIDRSKIPSELQNALLHPDQVPPGTLFCGPILSRTAASRGENLIAVLSETLVFGIGIECGKHEMAEANFNILKSPYSDEEMVEKDGWMVFRPKYHDDEDKRRINTTALAKLCQTVSVNGRASLDELAEYASANSEESVADVPIAGCYLEGLMEGGKQLLQDNDYKLLQFYGMMSPSQRAAAQAGMPIGRLSNTQVDLIQQMVFGMYSQLQLQPPMVTDANGNTMPDYQNFDWNSLNREPSEALPNGIPSDGVFTMTPDSGDVIFAHMKYGDYDQGDQAQDLDSLAWMLFQSQNAGGNDPGWSILSYRPGNRNMINFEFKFSPTVSQNMSLQESKITGNQVFDQSKLPNELRKKLQDKIAEIKKNNGDTVFEYSGQGGVAAPPY